MTSSLFRCPITGARVHGFVVEEVASGNRVPYDLVTCLACGRKHRVNFGPGKIVCEDHATPVFVLHS
jgi:hypothetical protein